MIFQKTSFYFIIVLAFLIPLIFGLAIWLRTKKVEEKAWDAKKRQEEYRRQVQLTQQMMEAEPIGELSEKKRSNPDDQVSDSENKES